MLKKIKIATKRIFGVHNIYERKYGVSYFYDGLIAFAVLSVVGIYMQRELEYGVRLELLATGVVVIWLTTELVRAVYISRLLQRRDYLFLPETNIDSAITKSAASDELDGVDVARLIEESDNWKLYDATFDFYRETDHGRYKSRQAYYTVFEIKLNRPVPHLIFDSIKAKQRQFKKIYLQAQRISLEGNFDQFFETYAPQSYHIDALSFITPEVMEAMIDMNEYDIEFIDDSLLCYAPLLTKPELEEFKQKCLNLHHHVDDNLVSYSDNRASETNKDQVTDFGKRLLNSPMRYVPLLVVAGAGSAIAVYVASQNSWLFLLQELPLFAILIFISTGYKIVKTLRENAKLEARFLQE